MRVLFPLCLSFSKKDSFPSYLSSTSTPANSAPVVLSSFSLRQRIGLSSFSNDFSCSRLSPHVPIYPACDAAAVAAHPSLRPNRRRRPELPIHLRVTLPFSSGTTTGDLLYFRSHII
ncbi:hypothetical protein V8G54_015630 [Vigna mungo]|uniref:Uncharacterized protein n=1 Tax=Vigna mungo TaxID=3915 RepID=A0AAQ3NIU9_VIGMU